MNLSGKRVLVTHNSVMAWTLQPVPCWTRDGC